MTDKGEALKGDNQLIAEFMGFRQESENDGRFHGMPETPYHYSGVEWRTQTTFYPDSMKYSESWDWLMPVIMKIETLGFDVRINGISCSVNRLCERDPIVARVCGDRSQKITLVYSVVVKFIKWLNDQK